MSSRSRRFTRLRTTAEPTARLTTKPTFGPASLGTGPTGKSSAPETTEPPARRPERSVRRNSSGFLIRVCWGSTTPPARPRAARPVSPLASWVRRRAARGPFGDARPARRGRRGSACAGGSRGPWPADGYSAGTYACSLELQTRCDVRGRTGRASRGQILARPRPGSLYRRDRGQPVNGKGDRCAGQTEPPRTARSCSFARLPSWNTAISTAHPPPAT